MNQKLIILDYGCLNKQMVARKVREQNVYCEVVRAQADPDPIIAEGFEALIAVKDLETAPLGQAHTSEPEIAEKFLACKKPILVLGISNENKKIFKLNAYNVDSHIQKGQTVDEEALHRFLYEEAKFKGDWHTDSFIGREVSRIREQVGEGKVLLAMSGGVDSAVAGVLMHEAVGDQLTCVFVDHGLMRKNEGDEVEHVFKDQFKMNLIRINAQDRFLNKLAGVADAEQKRKIIGEEFIRVFEEVSQQFKDMDYLVQGTIYPDIIESGEGEDGKIIKSHHNVGGLPEDISFKGIIEPLRDLFKDEVRKVGTALGLPDYMVWRQPFPGPGLGVRCIGEITKEKLDILRDADAIFREEVANFGLDRELNQYFAVLPGHRSVGVKDDARTFLYTIVLRAIKTKDFMTAEWARLPYELLTKVSDRITSEVDQVNRVAYDITGKPPATVEWE